MGTNNKNYLLLLLGPAFGERIHFFSLKSCQILICQKNNLATLIPSDTTFVHPVGVLKPSLVANYAEHHHYKAGILKQSYIKPSRIWGFIRQNLLSRRDICREVNYLRLLMCLL